ncbi:MAG: Uncharacterized protein Greene041614_1099 [Parcubacteria group bacterium Greene0416_14]|nr:MAG: Uncharacterized protein Greene041614_1099 [Parcubacteria group bacterium Greene0416_14]
MLGSLMPQEKLKDILLRGKYVSPDDIRKAEEFAIKNLVSLEEYLLTEELITKDLIGQAIAESLDVAYANLNSNQPSHEQVVKIPEDIAKQNRIVLFRDDGNRIIITSDNPNEQNMLALVPKLFQGKKISIAYSLSEDIDTVLAQYQKPLETRFSKIIEKKGRVAPELLEEIFNDALLHRASDIHLEPRYKEVFVRFRVDGVLHEAGRIPKEYYENILNRIKVRGGMRIDEHFATQDGSLRYEKEGTVVDFRISIAPTVEGEKVALRILSAYVQRYTLGDLGLSSVEQELLRDAAEKPFGMILVAGPTGSGKTTTLYTLLKVVNGPDVNITTIEDPVEYRTAGINQIQVNAATDLTFAKGLRSIVRQDPDIILVGEIRDNETAEIAVNAALTGHLLFSTFHANDAATAIPRLLDMGIEPFLLASTLEVIFAQRLVRKICDQCRHSIIKSTVDFNVPRLRQILKYVAGNSITMYEGGKCEACAYTGYSGRTAIFEFIRITEQMKSLILRSPSSAEIWDLARAEGSKTLFENGLEKVKTGLTTLDELLRVAPPVLQVRANNPSGP